MKSRLRKTGEIVEIICWNGDTTRSDNDKVSYIDSKGNEVIDAAFNRYWDFEDLTDAELNAILSTHPKPINVVDLLFQASSDALKGLLSNPALITMQHQGQPFKQVQIVQEALNYGNRLVDAFIKQLNERNAKQAPK